MISACTESMMVAPCAGSVQVSRFTRMPLGRSMIASRVRRLHQII